VPGHQVPGHQVNDQRPHFIFEPAADHPGWWEWNLSDPTRFNGHALGRLIVRREGERSARMRMTVGRHHTNLLDGVHGGAILALIDVSLFAAAGVVLDPRQFDAVTLDTSCQFVGAGKVDRPLDTVTEVLRETGRLIFLRGLVVQDEDLVASFTGTVRKAPTR
jgi:uncharacterized protein (TIGR00369 family)